MFRTAPILFALLLPLLAGCQTYTLQSAATVRMDGGYRVTTPIAWSKRTDGDVEYWTVDGPLLNEVQFVKGLRDGDTLSRQKERTDGEIRAPAFRSSMSPLEIKEFYEASLAQAQFTDIRVTDFRPANFGGVPGFRFEMAMTMKDGLARQGLAAGAVRGGRLYMIVYIAAREHYFGRYRGDVERIVESVSWESS